ncbi:MAG: hypothetical protein ACKO5A_03800, partial [Actinomycetota bacterium]
MSGGVAYVHDPDGTFPSMVNFEMLALEEPTDEELAELKVLIETHVGHTDSARGGGLLEDWETTASQFVKVMPNDLRRVLDAVALAEAEGLDVVETIMASSQR